MKCQLCNKEATWKCSIGAFCEDHEMPGSKYRGERLWPEGCVVINIENDAKSTAEFLVRERQWHKAIADFLSR
jgi:hypothetical protein